jgi:polyphosphate kinase
MGPDMTEGQRAHAGNSGTAGPGGASVVPPGVWVDDSDEDDPVLRKADGSPVDTWRDEYPYTERMTREEYDHKKRVLQVELLKLQYWIEDSGGRIVILFEGRDAAGKGSTIKRFMEHLNPRTARVVALTVPTERERLLIAEGISLTKFWFSVTPGEQHTRFAIRQIDPVRQWKLSPTDIALLGKWDEYTAAKVTMFQRTDTTEAPWTVIKSNDKKRARLEAMRHLLAGIDYDRKDPEAVGQPDPLIVGAPADMRELEPGQQWSPTPFRSAGLT